MSIRDEFFPGGEDGDIVMICKIIVIVKLGRVISPLLKGTSCFFNNQLIGGAKRVPC